MIVKAIELACLSLISTNLSVLGKETFPFSFKSVIISLLASVRQENILNTNFNSKKSDKEIAHEKNLEEREVWHKLIVKVITWKDGTVGKGVVAFSEKITPKEWRHYKKRLTAASPVKDVARIEARLKETLEKIKKNGGFA